MLLNHNPHAHNQSLIHIALVTHTVRCQAQYSYLRSQGCFSHFTFLSVDDHPLSMLTNSLASNHPITPSPSLITSNSLSSSATYTREFLLTIAQTPQKPPAPNRLSTFAPILRHDSVAEWGVDECHSKLLDGEPVSKDLPIPPASPVGSDGVKIRNDDTSDHGDVIFSFMSPPNQHDPAMPVLVDFHDPFSSKRKASEVFQAFPRSVGSESSSYAGLAGGGMMANSLGERFTNLRIGARTSSISTGSTSPSGSISSPSRSRSSSFGLGQAGLNPFAAPFPLPPTQSTSTTVDIPSLPLPKSLPSSLPAKPAGPLPPVFVKRESAALPQPMALPDVAPLGKAWEGENSLSGNERRRRASELGAGVGMGVGSALGIKSIPRDVPLVSASMGEKRPERLVKLGERLRESVSLERLRGEGKDGVRA